MTQDHSFICAVMSFFDCWEDISNVYTSHKYLKNCIPERKGEFHIGISKWLPQIHSSGVIIWGPTVTKPNPDVRIDIDVIVDGVDIVRVKKDNLKC